MSNVGIEVEVESRSISQLDIQGRIREGVLSTWELDTNEGSLRGGPLGWELRTTGRGVPFERVPSVLNELYPVLGQSTGVWRSAVHVHVDVRQLSNYQRALALALAYVADYDIFRQVSPEREESNFCVPLENKTAQVTRDVVRLARGGPSVGYGKYSSVNILPMRTFGTMEFRHMRTPECDNTVPSIGEALHKIQHFVNLAHSVVTLGAYAPVPASYAEVVEVFSMLAHNRFLWQAVGLTPRKEAALAVMLALASVPSNAPEAAEVPVRDVSTDQQVRIPARFRRAEPRSVEVEGTAAGFRATPTYGEVASYFANYRAQSTPANPDLWEQFAVHVGTTDGGTE